MWDNCRQASAMPSGGRPGKGCCERGLQTHVAKAPHDNDIETGMLGIGFVQLKPRSSGEVAFVSGQEAGVSSVQPGPQTRVSRPCGREVKRLRTGVLFRPFGYVHHPTVIKLDFHSDTFAARRRHRVLRTTLIRNSSRALSPHRRSACDVKLGSERTPASSSSVRVPLLEGEGRTYYGLTSMRIRHRSREAVPT
jgi:hypothetical protein